MTLLQTFRDGPVRRRHANHTWQNAMGSAVLFATGMGIAWVLKRFAGLTWDQALLVEILWLVSMLRWHQPDKGSSPNG